MSCHFFFSFCHLECQCCSFTAHVVHKEKKHFSILFFYYFSPHSSIAEAKVGLTSRWAVTSELHVFTSHRPVSRAKIWPSSNRHVKSVPLVSFSREQNCFSVTHSPTSRGTCTNLFSQCCAVAKTKWGGSYFERWL